MNWQPPDSHRTYPAREDDHRAWPALPPIVVLLGALVVMCVLACAALGWI